MSRLCRAATLGLNVPISLLGVSSFTSSTPDGAQQHVREWDQKRQADNKHGAIKRSMGPVAEFDGADQQADRVDRAHRGREVQQRNANAY
jgi:hypothetical protein